MMMNLYFAVDVFSAGVDTSDFCGHISQTDSRFCIWQRF